MTNRMKATVGLLAYLLGNSILFGALFSKKHILIGLAAGLVAQSCAAYLLILVTKTEP